MPRRIMIITVCLVFLSGLISSLAGAQAQDKAKERKEHEQATEKTLTELNRKMDELAAGFRKTEDQTRDELNRLYDEFKTKQGSARKDLEEMRNATNEKWDQMKLKMNKSIEELNKIYERAKSRDKDTGKPADATK
jgi:uncharacterized coiled-coil protein SlyX